MSEFIELLKAPFQLMMAAPLFSQPSSWPYLLLVPEMILAGGLCLMIVINAFSAESKVITVQVFFIVLAITLISMIGVYFNEHLMAKQYLVEKTAHFQINEINIVLKTMMLVFASLIGLYNLPFLKKSDQFQAEYFYFLIIILLGSFIMVSASNLMTLYLGIELGALSTYSIIAMNKTNPTSTEAALKYFILGAIISAVMLFGISFIYGLSGALNYTDIAQALSALNVSSPSYFLAVGGIVLLLVGILFKLGAAPLHVWMPDVYSGSSLAVVQIISSVSKLAAFGIIVGLAPIMTTHANATPVVFILYGVAITTLIWGNLAALVQTNIKKIMAYSAIGHTGFVLLAIGSQYDIGAFFQLLFNTLLYGQEPLLVHMHPSYQTSRLFDAFLSALFYISVYALSALAFLGALLSLSHSKHTWKITDLNGLGPKHPWLGIALTIMLFSMMGMPPTLGFYTKLTVFLTLVQKSQFIPLSFALLASVISVFYYLKILKSIWFEPAGEHVKIQGLPAFISVLISLFLLFGFLAINNLLAF